MAWTPPSHWLTRFLRLRRPALLCGDLAAVLILQAGTAWARGAALLVSSEAGAETMDAWRQDLQRSPVAERFGRLAMALAAPNAIIVCDWEQATVLWYFQRVEGARPDLTIRYPIERLDETLAEARAAGRTVYITRTLPGVESRDVTSSVGPLLQVHPRPSDARGGGEDVRFEGGLTLVRLDTHDWRLRPGGVLPATISWRADALISQAYAVSVASSVRRRRPRRPGRAPPRPRHLLRSGLRSLGRLAESIPDQAARRRWSVGAIGGVSTSRQIIEAPYTVQIEVHPPDCRAPTRPVH